MAGEPNNRIYEQLINTNQAGGLWQHPIYGRRRRGGGAKLTRILRLMKTVGKGVKDQTKAFVKHLAANSGQAIVTDTMKNVMLGENPALAVKKALNKNKGNLFESGKTYVKAEIAKRAKGGGRRKKKAGGSKKKRKGGKKTTTTKRKKKKGGRVKNKKLTSNSSSNQTRKRRVTNPYF